MSKKDVSPIVSAAGAMSAFCTALNNARIALRITDEDFYEMIKPESPLIPKFAKLIAEAVKILRLISSEESLILDAVDGTKFLLHANNMFSYVGPDFKIYDINKRGPATRETPVQVYEMIRDATFTQMFIWLSSDLDKLCLTQHQIINFIDKHQIWLRTDGYSTFFLIKPENKFFVVSVRAESNDKPCVRVDLFESLAVWKAGYHRRLVIPQLA